MSRILYSLLLCVLCLGWSAEAELGAQPVFAAERGGRSDANWPGARGGAFSTTATPAVASDWDAFHDGAHGLTIFYPPGWLFFDPTHEELSILLERLAAPVDADIMSLLMQLQSDMKCDAFIGFGFQFASQGSFAPTHVNNVIVEAFPARGLTLYQFAQGSAAHLDRRGDINVDSFDLVTRLRPQREEAVSIRFRGAVTTPATGAAQPLLTGSRTAGWQVVLLSPDAELVLVLTFTILGDQFDELEPLLTEFVRRVQWVDRSAPAPTTGPVTIAAQTMRVHSAPGAFNPVIGKVVAGKQFSIIDRDSTGTWWRISYNGQPGWVSDRYGAAANAGRVWMAANMQNAPAPPAAVPVVMIRRRVQVRSGPGASNPVIGAAGPGQQYLVTGKNAAGDWWQIDDNGLPGWVSGESVTPVNAGSVPVAVVKFPLPPLLPVMEAMVTINWHTNVRSGPDTSYPIVDTAAPGQQYPVTGKNAAGDWWRIDNGGQPGWVFGELVTPVNAASVQEVVRFPLPPPLSATEAMVTINSRMNIRSGPDTNYPVIGTTVPGQRYHITGRNAAGDWWRIDNGGQPGWVFGQLVRIVRKAQERQ